MQADMIRSLRENSPVHLDGMPVLEVQDYLATEHGPLRSETERLSRNLLMFELDRAQVIIRPSGTEPKVKIYVDVEGSKLPGENCRKNSAQCAQRLAARVVDDCIGRIGFALSASAKLLPDYVDLDLKADFGAGFRSDVVAAATNLAQSSDAERLQWLRDRLESYGAGADPLGPAGPALGYLLEELRRESNDATIKESLLRLADAVAGTHSPTEWTS
jgi:hypothetical protein